MRIAQFLDQLLGKCCPCVLPNPLILKLMWMWHLEYLLALLLKSFAPFFLLSLFCVCVFCRIINLAATFLCFSLFTWSLSVALWLTYAFQHPNKQFWLCTLWLNADGGGFRQYFFKVTHSVSCVWGIRYLFFLALKF